MFRRKYAGRVLLSALLFSVRLACAQSPSFEITGFHVDGVSLLPPTVVQTTLAPFVGPGRTLKDVKEAAVALRRAYAAAGYPIVQVYPPEQTLSGGDVRLQVIEGKIAQVTVAGNKLYDAANIRASLPPLKEGQSPNAADLVAALTLANDNPAKQLAVNFQAGVVPGEVDARIDVSEDRPEKYIVNYDNAGAKATGYDRLSVAYQNANIANRDQMATLQYGTTIAHPDDVYNLVGGYRIPFYDHGLSLDLIGAYSSTQSRTVTTAGPLLFTGRGTYLGMRLNQGLPGVGELRHKLSYGFDYKDFGNACTVAATSLESCGSVTSMPLSATYILQYTAAAVQAGGTIGYFMNVPGGMHGAAADYAAARFQAGRHWSAWRFSGFVGMPLARDWQLRLSGNAQLSSNDLVPAEQFGLGGATSVRGYDERTTSGDYGFSANLELYTPDLAKWLAREGWQIRGLVFADSGTVYRMTPTVGTSCTSAAPVLCKANRLSSLGFGVRASLRRELSVKMDVAWARQPWRDTSGATDGADTRSLAEILGLNRANGPGRSSNEASAHVSVSYAF